jgi:hypothetical protein
MHTHIPGRSFPTAFLSLAAIALLAAGCSSGFHSTSSTSSNVVKGTAFVVGTDAPMASVASFSVQIQSVVLTNDSGSTASLISGTPTVDFARYNGLQSLLDMNYIPVGTYTGVTITLGAATLGYLDTSTTPPSITTETATLTSSSIGLTLDKPLVVATAAAPVGLRMDFDLQKSIGVDSSGAITGTVTPTFNVNTITTTDSGAHIDELIAAVIVPPTGTTEPQTFTVQGPHGQQFTINTSSQTTWDGDATLGALTTSSIVLVSGQLNSAAQTLDADEVAILSQTGFYASGLVTYVTPATGAATSFDLYVRGLLPANTGVHLGNIATVDLTGSETYTLNRMHNTFKQFTQTLFNQSGLLAGQDVAIGGSASGATDASAVAVSRVTLRHQGYIGTVVAGSENASNGTFQMQVNGFAGLVIPQKVTVYMGGRSDFRYGCGAFSNLTDGATVRIVGLLVKDPTTGDTVLLARHVDGFNFNSFNVSQYQ